MVQLVGILNITPDSFSDGGKFINPESALNHARQMFKDGASLIDVGAESTRPNALKVTPEEEWSRLEKVLTALISEFPGRISLDSHNINTIEKAFKIGPVIINDVTGMNDPAMVELVLKLHATTIISHLPGIDIQAAHRLVPVSTIQQLKDDLLARAELLESRGLSRKQIILDPGIGFGKTMDLNKQLLTFGKEVPDYKVMIGYSRKRFLGNHRMELAPNIDAGKIAIKSGATFLRVHDVLGHAINLTNK